MTVIYQCLNAHYIFMNVFEAQEKNRKRWRWMWRWDGGEAGQVRTAKRKKENCGGDRGEEKQQALMHKVIRG